MYKNGGVAWFQVEPRHWIHFAYWDTWARDGSGGHERAREKPPLPGPFIAKDFLQLFRLLKRRSKLRLCLDIYNNDANHANWHEGLSPACCMKKYGNELRRLRICKRMTYKEEVKMLCYIFDLCVMQKSRGKRNPGFTDNIYKKIDIIYCEIETLDTEKSFMFAILDNKFVSYNHINSNYATFNCPPSTPDRGYRDNLP